MIPSRTTCLIVFGLATALLAAGCGAEKTDSPSTPASGSELTDFQLTHGIGPVTEELELTSIDDVLADSGATSFTMKCAACHKLDERYVGPPLGGITDRRSPTYIMNMILNPDGMIKSHPDARQMLAEYMTMMPNQNIQRPEARAILEYLRRADAASDESGQ